MKKILIGVYCMLAFAVNSYSQTKEDEARVLYQKAETAYEQGDYSAADANLTKIQNLIGANPKILYLRVKAIKAGIDNGKFSNTEGNYALAMRLLKQLFGSISKDTYPPEKYTEMVGIKLDVQEKLDKYEGVRAANEKVMAISRDHFLNMKNREAAFLRDTFDVYMEKLAKNFNDYNLAIFDPNASTISSSEYLEQARKFMKKNPELGPFIHHLEYNAASKELYIYHYTPDKDNTAKPCCPDTIAALGAYISCNTGGYTTDVYDLMEINFYNRFNNKRKTSTIKLYYHIPGKNWKNDFRYRVDVLRKYNAAKQIYEQTGVLADLDNVMRQTGFDEYFSPVFAYSLPDGKGFYRLSGSYWGEFVYPKREPAFKFKVDSDKDGVLTLFDADRKVYIKLTNNECLSGTDQNNITTKLHDGAWIKGSQLFEKPTVQQEIEAAIVAGKYDGLAEKIQAAITNDPKNKLLYYYLGLNYYNPTLALRSDIEKAYDEAARATLRQKITDNYTKAAQAFKKAIEIDPEYVDANEYLGYILLNIAIDFDNAPKNLPPNKQNFDAVVAKSNELYDAAKPYLLKTVAMLPKSVGALKNLQLYYLVKKDTANASMLQKQIEDLSK